MECAAIIDSLRLLQVLDDDAHARAIELVARIVAMLTKQAVDVAVAVAVNDHDHDHVYAYAYAYERRHGRLKM